MQWKPTNYTLDNFIAPKMSKLTEFNAVDVSSEYDQLEHWISNFILNSTLHLRLDNRMYLFIFNYLRRTQAAFFEYDNARLLLEEYIQQHKQEQKRSVTLYLKVLFHFETFIAQSYQAFSFLQELTETKPAFKAHLRNQENPPPPDLFEGEGILFREKLRKFYNFSKHMEDKIQKEECPLISGVPLWITNEGLEHQEKKENSEVWCLTWIDIKDILSNLAEGANFFLKIPQKAKEHSGKRDKTEEVGYSSE